jgi:sec-independent protein translocase protein TatB
MFDFAWSEVALIAVVALIVVGPKDLPRVLRTVGFWVRKARTVAREFQGSLEQMVREAELDEVRKEIDKAASFNFERDIQKHIDPTGEIARALEPPVLNDPPAPTPSTTATPGTEAAATLPPPEPPPEADNSIEPPRPAGTQEPPPSAVAAEEPASKSGTHA